VPRSMPISLENRFPKSFLNMDGVENERVSREKEKALRHPEAVANQ
jgi:hypothetical protein